MDLYKLAHEYQHKNKNDSTDDEISDSELFDEDNQIINLSKQAKAVINIEKPKVTTSLDTLMPTILAPKPEALPKLDNYSESSSEINPDSII